MEESSSPGRPPPLITISPLVRLVGILGRTHDQRDIPPADRTSPRPDRFADGPAGTRRPGRRPTRGSETAFAAPCPVVRRRPFVVAVRPGAGPGRPWSRSALQDQVSVIAVAGRAADVQAVPAAGGQAHSVRSLIGEEI